MSRILGAYPMVCKLLEQGPHTHLTLQLKGSLSSGAVTRAITNLRCANSPLLANYVADKRAVAKKDAQRFVDFDAKPDTSGIVEDALKARSSLEQAWAAR